MQSKAQANKAQGRLKQGCRGGDNYHGAAAPRGRRRATPPERPGRISAKTEQTVLSVHTEMCAQKKNSLAVLMPASLAIYMPISYESDLISSLLSLALAASSIIRAMRQFIFHACELRLHPACSFDNAIRIASACLPVSLTLNVLPILFPCCNPN